MKKKKTRAHQHASSYPLRIFFFRTELECVTNMNYGLLLLVCASIGGGTFAADILMLTMGGTKSHKIPFQELAKGLIPR